MVKIMIVDNERFTVKIVEKIIEKAGYQVLTAYSGQECLEIIGKEKPDLILLDIMMPEMSGWDVLKKIRANPETKGLKVVMLSAKQKEVDEDLTKLSDGYIPKPFERTTLIEKLVKYL